jgi:hypothetical protein
MTQGQTYKFTFFLGLLACNICKFLVHLIRSIVRCILLTYESIGLAVGESIDKLRGATGAIILQDMPTLFLMSAISLFIYYIGQLTIQLESQRIIQISKL